MFQENKDKEDSFSKSNHDDKNFFGPTRHLYFYFQALGNAGLKNKIKTVCTGPELEFVNFSNTGIDDGVIDTIIESFIQNENQSLKEINLSGNDFTDMGISRLLNAIETTEKCKLHTLNLRANPKISQDVLKRAETLMEKRKSSIAHEYK